MFHFMLPVRFTRVSDGIKRLTPASNQTAFYHPFEHPFCRYSSFYWSIAIMTATTASSTKPYLQIQGLVK
ncbi:hypothetical protein MM710_34830, partial [Klebsiella pneumoniae]|nr:hypothetical protein [Klebsiella pneumoniae]